MVIGNTGGIGNIRHRPAARAEQPAYTNHAGNAVPVEQWRLALENFRPAAEEAAVRDEEAAQFTRFGGNDPSFMSV